MGWGILLGHPTNRQFPCGGELGHPHLHRTTSHTPGSTAFPMWSIPGSDPRRIIQYAILARLVSKGRPVWSPSTSQFPRPSGFLLNPAPYASAIHMFPVHYSSSVHHSFPSTITLPLSVWLFICFSSTFPYCTGCLCLQTSEQFLPPYVEVLVPGTAAWYRHPEPWIGVPTLGAHSTASPLKGEPGTHSLGVTY